MHRSPTKPIENSSLDRSAPEPKLGVFGIKNRVGGKRQNAHQRGEARRTSKRGLSAKRLQSIARRHHLRIREPECRHISRMHITRRDLFALELNVASGT